MRFFSIVGILAAASAVMAQTTDILFTDTSPPSATPSDFDAVPNNFENVDRGYSLEAIQLAAGIQAITEESKNLNVIFLGFKGLDPRSFTLLTIPRLVVSFTAAFAKLGKIVINLTTLDKELSRRLTKRQVGPGFGDLDATFIVEVLTLFVNVHIALLNTIIGEQGIISKLPLGKVVATPIRGLEKVVDSVAFKLIDTIPTQKKAAEKQLIPLQFKVKEAANTYT